MKFVSSSYVSFDVNCIIFFWNFPIIFVDLTAEDHTGGLLLAVCRGKVSEGLDFTDDNARAVLTVH